MAETRGKKAPKGQDLKDLLQGLGTEWSASSVQQALAQDNMLGVWQSEYSDASGFTIEAFRSDAERERAHCADAGGGGGIGASDVGSSPGSDLASRKRSADSTKPAAESEGKRAKFFDAVESKLKLRTKAENDLFTLTTKIDECLQVLVEGAAKGDELVKEDRHMFSERVCHGVNNLEKLCTGVTRHW